MEQAVYWPACKIRSRKLRRTFDFFRCVSVYNLSQFGTQDHWRKLIFTLKAAEKKYSTGRNK